MLFFCSLATKKGRKVLAEKISDLARGRAAEERRRDTVAEEYSGTQPLFEDEEEIRPHSTTDRQPNPTVDNVLQRRSDAAKPNFPIPNNEFVRNPFKVGNFLVFAVKFGKFSVFFFVKLAKFFSFLMQKLC